MACQFRIYYKIFLKQLRSKEIGAVGPTTRHAARMEAYAKAERRRESKGQWRHGGGGKPADGGKGGTGGGKPADGGKGGGTLACGGKGGGTPADGGEPACGTPSLVTSLRSCGHCQLWTTGGN